MKYVSISILVLLLASCKAAKQNDFLFFKSSENSTIIQNQLSLQQYESKAQNGLIRPSPTKFDNDPVRGLSSNPDLNSKILQQYIDSVPPYTNVYLPRG